MVGEGREGRGFKINAGLEIFVKFRKWEGVVLK